MFVGKELLFAVLAALTSITLSAQHVSISQPTIWAAKPDIATFEKIENDRLAAAQAAIDKLVILKEPRTVENTLAQFDEAIRQINSARNFASLVQNVHPDAAFRDHATAMFTRAVAARAAIRLNRDVFNALAALDLSGSDSATRYYVNRQLLLFHLAGVDRDEVIRARLKKLKEQVAEGVSMIDRNVADDKKVIQADLGELEGLPQDYIDRHKPDSDGKVHITTDYPDAYPLLTFAKSDALRRRMWIAFNTRAYPKNKEVLTRLMNARYEIAILTGFASWAEYNAADKMIEKGQNVGEFIQQIRNAAAPLARREFEMLLSEKQKSNPGTTDIWEYEERYYSEVLRRSKYDFDSQSVRPYFPFSQVRQGILDTASEFFHVSFQEERDVPAWDPAVETWMVLDQSKPIGRFYLDMHPRSGKYSHAMMLPILDGIHGHQLPEAILVCNFPAPTVADPGLMTYDDVSTFFHEFGHLMHHILGGNQSWAGISGITMESDFAEAPSQMLEELLRNPQVLAKFARHYKTGEPIPAELVGRMNRADAFGRASFMSRQLSLTAISYDIYRSKPENVDLDAVTKNDTRNYTLFSPLPDTHFWASFAHLGGYSSMYYTYLWDRAIAEDFLAQFNHKNLLTGDAAARYRKQVLEPGGSMSANDLVKNFLGRSHNMAALQRWMGQEFDAAHGIKQTAAQ